MPSLPHEVVIDLFRHQPALVAPLLDALGWELPEYRRVEVQSGELPLLAPTEYHADTVTVFHSADRPVLAVVIEVQLRPDPDKVWSWPVYVAALRARLKCPTVLLVVCPDKRTAAWASEPLAFGYGDPYVRLRPLVLDPGGVPVVTDLHTATELPELAVLSAMAHAEHPDNTEVFRALLAALSRIGNDRATLYYDFVLSRLPQAARAAWEALMTAGLRDYEYQSDFARKFFTEGKAEGEARALLEVLDARGIAVSDAIRARIDECTDIEQLTVWIRRAITVTTAEELFD